MKAILIIDIDGSLIEGEERFAIDGYLMQESDSVGCFEAVERITNAVLKPLPQRKTNAKTHEEAIYMSGYNTCVSDIEEIEE